MKSVPYTPDQNGLAELDNRTLVEAARTMLISKGIDKRLCAEAVNAVVYILNRTGTSSESKKTAYEKWFLAQERLFPFRSKKGRNGTKRQKKVLFLAMEKTQKVIGYGLSKKTGSKYTATWYSLLKKWE